MDNLPQTEAAVATAATTTAATTTAATAAATTTATAAATTTATAATTTAPTNTCGFDAYCGRAGQQEEAVMRNKVVFGV